MLERKPSRTAVGAAGYRAAHQILDEGAVFSDPYACTILGEEAEAVIHRLSSSEHAPLRLFMAARSRFAEDCLADAVSRGVRQAVVLGAGLDTLALRNPHVALGVRMFEVDHPATQLWKLRRLKEAGFAIRENVRFVAVDFERDKLTQELAAADFDKKEPAFFIWLGVVPYLTRQTIADTLAEIVTLPSPELVFDYSEPLDSYPPDKRAKIAALAAYTAALGEPWLSHFQPREIAQLLAAHGLTEQNDLGQLEIAVRYFGADPATTSPSVGAHVLHARKNETRPS